MNSDFLLEVLTPKLDVDDPDASIKEFSSACENVLASGCVVSIPDNPMGILRFQALEVMTELGLAVPRGQLLLHINTFHTRKDLEKILNTAAEMRVADLLLVSGDGGERLPRVEPEDLGIKAMVVTSVGLVEYVRREYPSVFRIGVAFNPYEPADHEQLKLKQKKDAGADFLVTQPVVGLDMRVLPAINSGLPVHLGAWMSRRLDLLSRCVGAQVPDWKLYDPIENLLFLHRRYRRCGLYLSMLHKGKVGTTVSLLKYDGIACSGCCECG